MGRIDSYPQDAILYVVNEPWTAFTPTLGADTTPPNLGTGPTQTGRYYKIGRTVVGNIIFYFGTSPTAGLGSYRFNLPVTSINPVADHISIGSGYLYDTSASFLRIFSLFIPTGSTTYAYGLLDNPSGTSFISNSVPWVWAVGDRLVFNFTYEAAS